MLREFLHFIKSFKKRFALYYLVFLAAYIFGFFPFMLIKLCALVGFAVLSALFLPVMASFFVSSFRQFALHRSRIKLPVSFEVAELAKKAGVNVKELGIVKANTAYVIGKSLVLGIDLLEKLSFYERQAVVAHELGHIKRRHTIIKCILPIPFLVILMLSWLRFNSPIFFSESITRIILTIILNIAGLAFLLLVMIPINWYTEFDADKFAANLVGKDHIRSALLKIVDKETIEEPSETHPSIAERLRLIDKLDSRKGRGLYAK